MCYAYVTHSYIPLSNPREDPCSVTSGISAPLSGMPLWLASVHRYRKMCHQLTRMAIIPTPCQRERLRTCGGLREKEKARAHFLRFERATRKGRGHNLPHEGLIVLRTRRLCEWGGGRQGREGVAIIISGIG